GPARRGRKERPPARQGGDRPLPRQCRHLLGGAGGIGDCTRWRDHQREAPARSFAGPVFALPATTDRWPALSGADTATALGREPAAKARGAPKAPPPSPCRSVIESRPRAATSRSGTSSRSTSAM